MESEANAALGEKRLPIKKILIGCAALLVGVLLIVNIYRVSQKDVVNVDMARVTQRQLVEKVPSTGKIVASDREVLFCQSSGMVKTIYVQLGETVKAGQVLIELSVPNAEEKLAQARADVSQAEAELAQVRSGGQSAEEAAAVLALNEARSDWEEDEQAMKRASVLYEQGGLAKADYDKARANLEKSAAALNKARGDLERARGSAPARLKALEATLESARLHLQTAEQMAKGQGLVSPRDGRILSLGVSPGDMVNELSPILTISTLDKLMVEGGVPEAEASKIRTGQKVKISGNAFSDTRYEGRVSQVGLEVLEPVKQQADSTRELPIMVEIDNAGPLLPGCSVDMDITTAEENALIVPVEALVEKDETHHVWLVKDGEARLVQVATGISDGLTIQIKTGLELDCQVVINPPADLVEGKKVRKK